MSGATTTFGIVSFPGATSAHEAARAVKLAGGSTVELASDSSDLAGVDAVILPGGFSFGDYGRPGALAAQTPIVKAIVAAVNSDSGLPVLGIGNGFQVLTEAGLLPGALAQNDGVLFNSSEVRVRIETADTTWTSQFRAGQEIVLPLKNQFGRYVADEDTVAQLTAENRVVARYVGDNPNGSTDAIAGVANETGRVVGLMVRPEFAFETGFGTTTGAPNGLRSGTDGLGFFASGLAALNLV